jgi:hypothetical protein
MTITGITPPSLDTGLTPTFPFSMFGPSTWPNEKCCSAANPKPGCGDLTSPTQ